MKISIVQTTCDSKKEAKKLAKILLESKLAACIQIIQVDSLYMWKDELCDDEEYLLNIKTKSKLFNKIERKIKENHSYDVPEIIEIKIKNSSKDYKDFIKEFTS